MLSGTLICFHFQFFSLELILFEHNSVPRVNVKLLILLLYRKQINYYAWYWKWVVRLALGKLEKYTHYFKWYLIYMYNSVFKIICNIQIANTASRKVLFFFCVVLKLQASILNIGLKTAVYSEILCFKTLVLNRRKWSC